MRGGTLEPKDLIVGGGGTQKMEGLEGEFEEIVNRQL